MGITPTKIAKAAAGILAPLNCQYCLKVLLKLPQDANSCTTIGVCFPQFTHQKS